MRPLVTGLILTAVLAACGPQPGTLFSTTLLNLNGEFPLPVELRDTTDLVVAIGAGHIDSIGFRDAGVFADPTDPTAFILTWLGGMCDNDATVNFTQTESGYDLRLEVHEKFGGGCPAAGIFRGLQIEASEPIPVGTVTISGSRTIQLILDEDCGPLTAAETDDAKVACYALIGATIGERPDEFARGHEVLPDGGTCPGAECSTAAGIAAQPWRVVATDRTHRQHAWRCTYRDEKASCTVITEPSPP